MLNLDLYGVKPCLFSERKLRNQTYFGLSLLLMSMTAVCVIGIFLFINYVKGDQMTLVYSKQSDDIDMDFSLNERIFFYTLSRFINENNVEWHLLYKSNDFIANIPEGENTFNYLNHIKM